MTIVKTLKISTLAIAMLVLAGCASGVKHKDMSASIATIPADQGRIYFWRSASMVGAALQPNVILDGKVVGESKPGGFFYVDAPAGNHEVSTATEVEKKLTFTLEKSETKYVRTTTGFGLIVGRVYPELAGAEESLKELGDLSYTGEVAAKR
jgi:outer membrane murein-binding lipoprotein Lpp